MTVVTRFAPSPTGFLHIGGARTALFNWLFARHHNGKFLMRIEDTDRERSTQAAVDAIFDGLSWLGLDWDEEPTFQFARRDRHAEVAQQLLDKGLAYKCYCTPQELQEMRDAQRAAGQHVGYDGRWRDRDPADAPADVRPVIRFKAPQDGTTTLHDGVQGDVTIPHSQLDDMILLRSDGTPTYMLSVVVDDHDMGVTHIIRGDDHLTNTFRQYQLYKAMEWDVPQMNHIPLIHGADGAKLSKRHGALGAEAYRDMGMLPEAMCNYLLRLGWAHGDDEIISMEQAIAWFSTDGIGKAPSRFDMDKLTNLNSHYIKIRDNDRLIADITPLLKDIVKRDISSADTHLLGTGIGELKLRAKTLHELADQASFYVKADEGLDYDNKAKKNLKDTNLDVLKLVSTALENLNDWTVESLETTLRDLTKSHELKLGQILQPLRSALTGRAVSPPIFEVVFHLGKDSTLTRIEQAILAGPQA